jgi:hypothetical protein
MANFNNYLNSMNSAIGSTQQEITDLTGNMVQTFTTAGSSVAAAQNSIYLTSGLVGIVGAFAPEIAPATGAAQGLLGVFSGLMGLVATGPDTAAIEFTDFAGAQSALGKFASSLENAIFSYTNSMLNDPPQAKSATWDYSSDPKGLVQIFWGGAFAAPIASPPVPAGITAFLSSPVINYLWGSQKAFTVKLSDTVTGNACGSNLYPGQSFCDDSGVLHALLQWKADSFGTVSVAYEMDVSGVTQILGVSHLPDYNLTLQEVDASANYWQGLYGYGGSPNNSDVISALTTSLTPDFSKLYSFNMPVCDLSALWTSADSDALRQCTSVGGLSLQDVSDQIPINVSPSDDGC